jgi:hypothetical protein
MPRTRTPVTDPSEISFDQTNVSFDAGAGVSFDVPDIPFDELSMGEAKDPLEGMQYTGDLEKDTVAEASETLKAFRARAAAEEKRRMAAVDSEFWCAICFQTREQKESFLDQLGLLVHGDKYLDGAVVARALGLTLPPADVEYRQARIDEKLSNLSLPMKASGKGGKRS